MTVDKDKLIKLGQAFTFVVKNETYAVNRGALIIQREVDKGGDEYDHTEMWEAAYSILTHSANLSKIVWFAESRIYWLGHATQLRCGQNDLSGTTLLKN